MSPQPAKQPNIVLILADQQRYDSLGCYGNLHAVTPNLDGLARHGTVFHRHIAANPICMPSRASLLTGRYPNGHGVWHNGVPLPRSAYVRPDPRSTEIAVGKHGHDVVSHIPTLADVLAEADYHTGAVGKLHLTPSRAGVDHGYEECHTIWETRDMSAWHGPYYGFDSVDLAFAHGEGVAGHYRQWLAREYPAVVTALLSGEHRRALPFPQLPDLYPSVIPEEAHHTTWIGERACAFLERQRQAAAPFFLFVGFPDPHSPFVPPRTLATEFARHEALPPHADPRERATKPRALARWMERTDPTVVTWRSPADCIAVVRRYTDAMVHLIDRAVGRILDTLRHAGLWDDTIIVFTSDHGDFLGDHGLLGKGTVCSGALNHVPFLLRVPGSHLPAETRVPMSNADVLPTLCDLAGVPLPTGVQGSSILPDLRGGATHPVQVVCYSDDPQDHNFSVYDERFRFTWYPGTDERELYDHREDPYELRNRAGESAVAAEGDRLFHTLLELQVRHDNPSSGKIAVW